MLRTRVGVVLALLLAAGAAFAADKPDRVQGNWKGEFSSSSARGPISAKIIAEGDGNYRALVEARTDSGEVYNVELIGKGNGSAGAFAGQVDKEDSSSPVVVGTIAEQKFEGKVTGMDELVTFSMQRFEEKPPTLGMAPPNGATMLFDGQNQDKWQAVPAKWSLTDGAMQVGGPSLMTNEEYGAGTYHVEFMTPLMPTQRGQGRGNSGVYILGRYEVQVLDSFGLPPADNEAGGIYKMAVPKVNASLPPGEWQTYDIVFTPARFDAAGNKTEEAVISVEHNGVLIHDNVKLSAPTPGGVSDKDAPAGPLMLQNHGNPVKYRNIWFAPVNP